MNLLLIILTIGVGYTVYSRIKKFELNKAAVGRKVLLSYTDRNDIIKAEMPRTGVIKRMLRIGRKMDNFVIKLDEPIVFNNSNFNEVVVRERILGSYIGSNKKTDVHLLLPKGKDISEKEKWDSFEHVAWLNIRLQ